MLYTLQYPVHLYTLQNCFKISLKRFLSKIVFAPFEYSEVNLDGVFLFDPFRPFGTTFNTAICGTSCLMKTNTYNYKMLIH